MFFQWFEGTGKLVVRSGLSDLVVQRVDPVGEIDKSTPFWGGYFFGCLERGHAFEHGECDTGTHGPEGMTAVD